jgi:cyclopropane fatty-acyl-phospholipid synthase-like methyltransferase
LRLAYGIERHDRVLDVGCRAGLTTREAARMAVEGSVPGIGLSAVAIDRARELARAKASAT